MDINSDLMHLPVTITEDDTFIFEKILSAAEDLAAKMLANKKAYSVKGDPTLEELTNLIVNLEIEQYRLNELTDTLIDYNDEIESIECLDEDIPMIDIRVSGSNLFYANNILTKNSIGPIMTCDLAIGIIRTPELDEINQMVLKQLASRYGDPSYYKKFVVGIDKSRMKMYNVESSAQSGIQQDVTSKSTEDKPSVDRYAKAKKTVTSDDWKFDD